MSVDEFNVVASEYRLLNWEDTLHSPVKFPPINVRHLILDIIAKQLLQGVWVVNSKYLANPKCFGFKRVFWFQNGLTLHLIKNVDVVKQYIDCIVDACIQSSDVAVFFSLFAPLPVPLLNESGYGTERKVNLFEGNPKQDYFLDSYGNKLRKAFSDLDNDLSIRKSLVFFSHDAESIVVTT